MEATLKKEAQAAKPPLNPAVVMAIIVVIAGILTYLVPAGRFARDGELVVPGSYTQVPKSFGLWDVIAGTGSDAEAMPTSLIQLLAAVPAGITDKADLIFMVLFIGGMFGVLQRSGAIEAGLERALSLTRGNIMLLAPVLMIVFSFGSTFLGMAKEYLLVIPMVVAMTDRLGISRVAGLAIVAIPVKVGYLASITNPYALSVAQPLVGVPIFSGMWLRVVTYIVMMAIGIAFVLWKIRRERAGQPPAIRHQRDRQIGEPRVQVVPVVADHIAEHTGCIGRAHRSGKRTVRRGAALAGARRHGSGWAGAPG